VATVEEGVQLREVGVTKGILVLGALQAKDVKNLGRHNLMQTVSRLEDLHCIEQQCKEFETKQPIGIHIKVDTGLHRLGFLPSSLGGGSKNQVIKFLSKSKHLVLRGIFTHFCDTEDVARTQAQKDIFDKVVQGLVGHFCIEGRSFVVDRSKLLLHAGASGALAKKELHYDMVRVGLALYGYGAESLGLRPAMRVQGKIVRIAQIKKGDCVGYQPGYCADKDRTIATVLGGYGDGILRGVYTQAVVCTTTNEQTRVPIVGHISMDMLSMDVTGLSVCEGDSVYLMDASLDAQEIASQAGTIPYQLLTAMKPRTETVYEEPKRE